MIAETEGKDENVFQPDIGVTGPALGLKSTATAVAFVEPASETESIAMRAFIATEYRENFIEIYVTQPERILVTCIEILSPSNKRHDTVGWGTYMRKRQGLLLGEANFIEIDLLRGGERFPMLDPWPTSPYTLLVSRRNRAPKCRAWPAHFKRPLPAIPVPLLSPDPDVHLDLQPMIDAVYERARYGQDIDYSRPLSRPLTADEATWLAEQLRQRSSQTTPT